MRRTGALHIAASVAIPNGSDRAELDLPSVRERLMQLAHSPHANIAEVAQKRLAAAPR